MRLHTIYPPGERSMTEAKKAIITGASEGMGKVFAHRMAERGYQLTLVARSEDKLQALLGDLGGNHRYMVADLSTDAGINGIAEDIKANQYDILINNAGISILPVGL